MVHNDKHHAAKFQPNSEQHQVWDSEPGGAAVTLRSVGVVESAGTCIQNRLVLDLPMQI